jgi:PhnB protein
MRTHQRLRQARQRGDDPADAERRFNALAEGGTVRMPFGKTFFSNGFGMCVDKFGIPWMVNSPKEDM